LLALAGEDGLQELRVGVQPGAKIAGHGIDVKGRRPVLGLDARDGGARGMVRVLKAVTELKEKPVGLAGASRCCRG
jgi:hypothetical protein